MQLVLNIIAVAGFFMSLTTWVQKLWEGRKNLAATIDFDSHSTLAFYTSSSIWLSLAFLFENKSSNPITLSYATITFDKTIYKCQMHKEYVEHRFRKLIDTNTAFYEHFIESAEFPINIDSKTSVYEYIKFQLPFSADVQFEKISCLTLNTNRGEIKITAEELLAKVRALNSREPSQGLK